MDDIHIPTFSTRPPSPPLPQPPINSRRRQPKSAKSVSDLRSSKDSSDIRLADVRDIIGNSSKHLARLLVYEERESRSLQKRMLTLGDELRLERSRADAAEQRSQEMMIRIKTVNDARLKALEDNARLMEELRLYRVQMETAQREIFRAQDVLGEVERQRYEAEADAAKARASARRYREERMLSAAREEGRRSGVREGMRKGRAAGFEEGRIAANGGLVGYAPDFGADVGPIDGAMPTYDVGFTEGDMSMIQSPPPTPPQIHPMTPTPPAVVMHAPSSPEDIAIHGPTAHRTPRHPDVSVAPDSWIPERDASDNFIHLPPPHGLTQNSAPTSKVPLPPAPEGAFGSASSIPDAPVIPPTARIPRPAQRRTHSVSSDSTAFSKFDIVSPPEESSATSRQSYIQGYVPEQRSYPNPDDWLGRRKGLSVIQEVQTPESSNAPPIDSTPGLGAGLNRGGSQRSQRSKGQSGNRLSTSTGTSYNIDIQPPSDHSNQDDSPEREPGAVGSQFLSPADADRPVPLPRPDSVPIPAQASDSAAVPVSSLPRGFVQVGSSALGNFAPVIPPASMLSDGRPHSKARRKPSMSSLSATSDSSSTVTSIESEITPSMRAQRFSNLYAPYRAAAASPAHAPKVVPVPATSSASLAPVSDSPAALRLPFGLKRTQSSSTLKRRMSKETIGAPMPALNTSASRGNLKRQDELLSPLSPSTSPYRRFDSTTFLDPAVLASPKVQGQ